MVGLGGMGTASRTHASLRSNAFVHPFASPLPPLAPVHLVINNDHESQCPRRVVVGVPAHFTEPQRAATRQALLEAGFSSVSLMTESTAAAVAYGLFVAGHKLVLVFDAGGGTTDVTLMRITDGSFEALATAGDNALGGEDMDTALLELVEQRLGPAVVAAAGAGPRAALRRACARAKEELSSAAEATVRWASGEGGGRASWTEVRVTRGDLEACIEDLLQRGQDLVLRVLADAEVAANDVNEVVLVGGASRIPALRSRLKALFPQVYACSPCESRQSVASLPLPRRPPPPLTMRTD